MAYPSMMAPINEDGLANIHRGLWETQRIETCHTAVDDALAELQTLADHTKMSNHSLSMHRYMPCIADKLFTWLVV